MKIHWQFKLDELRHDKTNKVSVHPASSQSDQSLRCPHEETLGL